MDRKLVRKLRPYLAAVLLQFGYAGLGIIAKSALNQGMNNFTFAVYRNVVAAAVVAPFALTLERKIRPKMTLSVLYKIVVLAVLEPVVDQNLFYIGMKYTTATFAAAMCNTVPATTFLLAWAVRLERVDARKLHSQAKILGTIVTVGGAMVMTLVKGSVIALPWTREKNNLNSVAQGINHLNPIKGAIILAAACFCWSLFYILQAITLKSYPAGFSLTALVCMIGALQGTALTFAVERGNTEIWSLEWDTKLLAAVYSGVICSGVAYYVAGVIMKDKGPVFVTSFNPLNMVITAVMSSFILGEQLSVGKVAGATVIVIGLYLVIWGKTKDESGLSCPKSELISRQQELTENNGQHVTKTISEDNVV